MSPKGERQLRVELSSSGAPGLRGEGAKIRSSALTRRPHRDRCRKLALTRLTRAEMLEAEPVL